MIAGSKNIYLKRMLILLLPLLFILSCKEEAPTVSEEPDNKPFVEITSFKDSAAFENSLKIEVEAEDDKGIVLVEIFIDAETDSTKKLIVSPYIYNWTPSKEPDSTIHRIFAKAYNADGNKNSSKIYTVFHILLAPPSDLTMQSLSESLVKLEWKNNLESPHGFIVERKDGDNSEYQQISVTPSYESYYFDAQLNKWTNYTYRVKAFRGTDTTKYSNEIKIAYNFKYEKEDSVSLLLGTPNIRTPLSIGFSDNTLLYTFQHSNCYYYASFSSLKGEKRCLGNSTNKITHIASLNQGVKIFSTVLGKVFGVPRFSSFKSFMPFFDPISESVFLKNSSFFAVANLEGKIRIMRYQDSQIITEYSTRNPEGHTFLEYNSNDNIIISASENGTITYWDFANENIVKYQTIGNNISSLYYYKGNNYLYIGQENGFVSVFDLDNYERIKEIKVSNAAVTSARPALNGNYLVTASDDGKIKLWTGNDLVYYTIQNNSMRTAITLVVKDDLSFIAASSENAIVSWKNSSGWRIIQ